MIAFKYTEIHEECGHQCLPNLNLRIRDIEENRSIRYFIILLIDYIKMKKHILNYKK